MFTDAGLIDESNRRHLRFRYLTVPATTITQKASERWKIRHFLDTLLGRWTSDLCFRRKNAEFVVAGSSARAEEIAAAVAADEDQWKLWTDALVKAIRNVEKRLGPEHLSRWFDVDATGRAVDLTRYVASARRQLGRDQAKASSADYASRYVSGVDFLPVPRFREQRAQWEDFASSFAGSLVQQLQKGKLDNVVAKACMEAGIVAPDDSAGKALASLRKKWPKVYRDVEELLLEGMGDDE